MKMTESTTLDPHAVAVDGLYRLLLGRSADAAGLESFTRWLREGRTLVDVAGALLGSEEFALAGGVAALPSRLNYIPFATGGDNNVALGDHPLARWPDLYTPENAPFFSHRGLFRPAMLMVETVNICNNDCIICPYSAQTRPRQAMAQPLFEKLITEYAAIGGGAVSLTPLVGEVFLDKLLPMRIASLQGHPAITQISVTTNATMARRYSDGELHEILSAFRRVKVSVYGLDREEYFLMTRKDEYQLMLDQLVRLVGLSAPGAVVVGLRHLRKRSADEVLAWLADVAERAGVESVAVASETSEYANWSHFDISKPLPLDATWAAFRSNHTQCLIPLVALQAMSDGDISFCACANFDGNDDLMLGNIKEQSLTQLLDSEKTRKLWHWDKYGVPEFCRTCSFHIPMEAAKGMPWIIKDPMRFVGG